MEELSFGVWLRKQRRTLDLAWQASRLREAYHVFLFHQDHYKSTSTIYNICRSGKRTVENDPAHYQTPPGNPDWLGLDKGLRALVQGHLIYYQPSINRISPEWFIKQNSPTLLVSSKNSRLAIPNCPAIMCFQEVRHLLCCFFKIKLPCPSAS